MRKETTAERLQYIMKLRKLKQVDIIALCDPICKKFNAKLQKSDLSQYVSGKVEPSQYKLTILGLALGVSETWLMGFDVPMEREEKTPPPTIEVSEDERALIELFRCVPDDQKKLCLTLIRAALSTK